MRLSPNPPPPPNLTLWVGKSCQEPFFKYLREFSSDFNAYTLLFQDLFELFYPTNVFEIEFVCFPGEVTNFECLQVIFFEN